MDQEGIGEMAVTSVTQTMRDLCNQLKRKMREFVDDYSKNQGADSKAGKVKPEVATSRAIKEVFEQFDVDGNGVLDAKEMLVACQQLNLKITEEQVNLIWPMLDADGSGEVDIDEFFTIIEHQHQHLAAEKKELTSTQRQKRIQERTDMAKHFLEVAQHVRGPVRAYIAKEKLSMQAFFG